MKQKLKNEIKSWRVLPKGNDHDSRLEEKKEVPSFLSVFSLRTHTKPPEHEGRAVTDDMLASSS